QGAFDAYDDHRYAFYGWNKYFDKNSDALLEPGTPIEGKEGILGECNIGWTPVQVDWNAGHVRDMGGSMALLNAMLEMIGDGRYSRIVTWPSHYPSKASISGCPENAFGWFDLDQWYLEGKTVRLTGPAAAHRIVNQNVLENRLGASSSAEKVRVYAYCNAAQTDLRVIVLNKWDATQLTLNVPEQMDCVSAMVLSGESVWDTAPEYRSLFAGCEAVTGGSYTGGIPGESVVVYTFSSVAPGKAPGQPELLSPGNGAGGAGTAQAFAWTPVDGGRNYRLTVSPNADLSAPVIDTYTGMACRYQAARELEAGTTYYWRVTAENQAGSAASGTACFTTQEAPGGGTVTLNNDSPYLSYSANWNQQASAGSYRNDDASCKEKDGFVEFTFTGTGAKLYGLRGNWCGMADAQVDFGAPVRIDAYAGTTQEQALLFDTGELPYGEHTVTLTVAGEKNEASSDTWIEFDKVELSDSQNGAPVINKVVWDDENPNLKKFSVWKHQSVPGSYHDDDSSSNTWKAHIEFSFEGSNAVIYGLKGPWCGRAQITVDGAAAADIDAYAPEMMLQQVLYDTGTLEPGTHTVRITVKAEKSPESSGRWVEIDGWSGSKRRAEKGRLMGMETINAADWGVLPGDDVSLAARLGALLSTLEKGPASAFAWSRGYITLPAGPARCTDGTSRTTMRAAGRRRSCCWRAFAILHWTAEAAGGSFTHRCSRAASRTAAACGEFFPGPCASRLFGGRDTGGPPAADDGVDRPGKISLACGKRPPCFYGRKFPPRHAPVAGDGCKDPRAGLGNGGPVFLYRNPEGGAAPGHKGGGGRPGADHAEGRGAFFCGQPRRQPAGIPAPSPHCPCRLCRGFQGYLL
ncbi:MAG: hypothetical protein ACLS9Y_08800, partial [Ruthenibacterium lactatiformans]